MPNNLAPDLAPDPMMKEALYRRIVDENAILHQQNRSHVELASRQAAEIDLLKQRVVSLTRERNYLQGYANNIKTRTKVMKELADSIDSEAHATGMRTLQEAFSTDARSPTVSKLEPKDLRELEAMQFGRPQTLPDAPAGSSGARIPPVNWTDPYTPFGRIKA